jgi:hypothetical protein
MMIARFDDYSSALAQSLPVTGCTPDRLTVMTDSTS